MHIEQAESQRGLAEETMNWLPNLPPDAIKREHLLRTVKAACDNSPVVFLEADEGDGVSTFLAQFAMKQVGAAISLFVKPASRFSYGVDYLRQIIAEQYHWHTKQQSLSSEVVAPELFNALQMRMRSKVRCQTVYFVVDGIHQIPADDRRNLEAIFRDILPIGVTGFRFLIAGNQSELCTYLGKERSSNYRMLKFSDLEAEQYLKDLQLSDKDLSEITEVAAGNVGKLASIRRIIQGGTPWSSLAAASLSSYPDFIKQEFKNLSSFRREELLVVATVAHSRHPMSAADVADVVDVVTEAEVIGVLQKCTFIRGALESSIIEFTSDAHRRYAEKELEPFRKECHNSQVAHLLKNPSSSAALRFLPTYYQQLNNTEALVRLIGEPSHYLSLLAETQSVAALQSRAALAARSARELAKLASVLQFSVQRSIFRSLGAANDYPAEISALVALGQSQRALDIAAQSRTREARLTLIAQYARGVHDAKSEVDADVKNYIKELASQIDFQGWGEAALPVAESLLGVDLELALSIVDKAIEGETKQRNADPIYAKLAMDASVKNDPNRDAIRESARQRISNDDLRNLVGSVTSIFSDFSADDVIKVAKSLKIERRIYLLRSLASGPMQRKDGILKVVDFALDEMMSDAAYMPKAGDLADLAVPLSQTMDKDTSTLIRRFISQIELIDSATSSVDYVTMQMRLARAEGQSDCSAAKVRIEDAFLFAADVANPESQVLCLAAMLATLADMPDGELADFRETISVDVTKQMETKLTYLLENTASHYSVFTPTLRSLSIRHPQMALSLVSRFNTASARSEGYIRVVMEMAKQPLTAERAQVILATIGGLEGTYRNDAVDSVRGVVAHRKKTGEAVDLLRKLIELTSSPGLRCNMYIALMDAHEDGAEVDVVATLQGFEESLELMDDASVKVNKCFQMSASLARHSQDQARALYQKADIRRRQTGLVTRDGADLVILSAFLAMRSIKPLMRLGMCDSETIRRLMAVCDSEPSQAKRLYVASELVIRAWCEGKSDLASEIFKEHCQPAWASIESGDNTNLKQAVAATVVTATYCFHKGLAFSILNKHVAPPYRDSILVSIALMVLRRIAPSEPSARLEDEFHKANHGVAVDLIEILKNTTTDSGFAGCLSHACTVFGHKKNRDQITRQQRADFRDAVLDLISKKLPDPANIQHDGYSILCKAYLGMVVEKRTDEWQALIAEAESIGNLADRGFVLLEICNAMPAKLIAERKILLEKSRAVVDQIPAVDDRYHRLELYVCIARRIDPGEAKAALRRAVTLTVDLGEDTDATQARRQLVDLAELIEPGLADDLANLIDDDPARQEAKKELKRSAEIQRLKKDIVSTQPKTETGKMDDEHLPSAAWQNVKSLLADRLVPVSPEYLLEYVDRAGTFMLEDAYPIVSWYLENIGRRFKTAKEAEQFLVPAAEVTLLCAELTSIVACAKQQANVSVSTSISNLVDTGASLVVPPGMREQAVEFLGGWLRQHCGSQLIYCDPYFTQDDLEFLRYVLSANPGAKITVLTSKNAFKGAPPSSSDLYDAWRALNDGQEPPHTDVILLSNPPGSGPIHDRWIISGRSGLRVGTSFNSLGQKLSEISALSEREVETISSELMPYCHRERIVNGVRIDYMLVSI